MVYNLLKRIQNLLVSKPSGTKKELEILSLVNQALSTMLNGRDTETLAPNELLVRICPDTKRPVLVCYDGNGQCLCLHNGTTEEDTIDVDLWLRSNGKDRNGVFKLLETVADLAYNAGADDLCKDKDSRAVMADIVEWAKEFSEHHAKTAWETEDYILSIDRFYRKKVPTQIGNIYLSTIKHNHAGSPETSVEETDSYETMEDVLASEENCETFIETLLGEINSDDETCRHKARDLISSYRIDDCEGLLMALCGWSMKTLLSKYKKNKEGDNG